MLSTVTWDGVLDGWLFTWDEEGWAAWLRISWRLLGTQDMDEVRSGRQPFGAGPPLAPTTTPWVTLS